MNRLALGYNLTSSMIPCPSLPAQPLRASRNKTAEEEYAEALKEGSVPAAYARLMFLGAGGSGKSSLLDGLMNNPLRPAESTALADTQTVSYQWIKAADTAEEAWKLHSNEDEAKGLAAKSRQLAESRRQGHEGSFIKIWALAPAVKLFDVAGHAVDFLKRQVSNQKFEGEVKSADYDKIIEKAATGSSDHPLDETKPDVVLHIWDCGGQPVFLDIISAFLTPRTMFFLLFDSSLDLNSQYQEKWHHKGVLKPGRDQNVTHMQLMKQWLQLIHCSLVVNDDRPQSSPESEASLCQSVLPPYPRAILVGTHGDCITSTKAEGVIDSLQSACGSAAFGNLIIDNLIVDNTTAGKGKGKEDPGYKRIRGNIHEFAQSLVVDTPLAWVAFRQVVQEAARDTPILPFDEAVVFAKTCGIPQEVVPSVLHFYHQLGAMLHYVAIPSLANNIIVEPQWLIEQLRKLLMPSWYGKRPPHLNLFWKWLEERGVLLEELYQEIWRECGLNGGAQSLADLLDHFDLAKEVEHCHGDMGFYQGKKYFVPCILKTKPKEEYDDGLQRSSVRQAATLHILFNTGYVPPGFFVRLVARITTNKTYMPLLEHIVYRDSITFQCNEIDRFTITESLQSVKVNFYRKSNRKNHIHFGESCVLLFKGLNDMCNEALQWLPCVKVMSFAFRCTYHDSVPESFVLLKADSHQESTLFCQHDREYNLSLKHRLWLPRPPLPKHCIKDGPLTEDEVVRVSSELEHGGLMDLVKEMEMEYSLNEAENSRGSSRRFAYAIISDFAESEGGTRYKLAHFLRSTNFLELSRNLLKGKLQQKASSQDSDVYNNQPKIYDSPTLLQLDMFPTTSNDEELRIIREIGKDYILLGTHLLHDKIGARTEAIQHEYQKNAAMITYKIFQLWLQGSGKKPVSWATLIKVLKTIERKELAYRLECLLKNSDLLNHHTPTTSNSHFLFFVVVIFVVLLAAYIQYCIFLYS